MKAALTALLAAAYLVLVSAPQARGTSASPHDPASPRMTKHYEDSLFTVTQKGLFSVEMILKDKALKVGRNSLDLIIHDKEDNDVAGALITVTPWMPEHGHGVPEAPDVAERGGGLYTAGNVGISMPGLWEIRIAVKKDDASDTAVFTFYDVGGKQALSGSQGGERDTSATRLSKKRLFRVSYAPEGAGISLNTLQSWKLRVETAEGRPVENAQVTVEGEMPEHGHGLPTKPRVTRNLGGGCYLVEGVKFSMPGHWVITFTIEADTLQDSASFSLNLQ